MLAYSKIDDKLSIYRRKKLVLYGAGKVGKELFGAFQAFGIIPSMFCDNDSKKWDKTIKGIPIADPNDLLCGKDEYIVQVAAEKGERIEEELRERRIEYISLSEFRQRIYDLSRYSLMGDRNEERKYIENTTLMETIGTRNEWAFWDYIFRAKAYGFKDVLIVCTPPKTGTWSLCNSLSLAGVEYVNFWHCFYHMNEQAKEILSDMKIKIITAVREPIGQNISIFYNMSDTFWDEPAFWRSGGDVQFLFDGWIKREQGHRETNPSFYYFSSFKKAEKVEYLIQNFFEKDFYKNTGISVYSYPFDKYRGYSIINADNIEIFIYQIEKVKKIENELAKFLNISNFSFTRENIGDNKWYANSYREALEKLRLSAEYVDVCMNSDYIRHFYSEEDISIFYRKWDQHIY